MNQIVTTGIVLSRLNYGEADRIISVITPDHGKLRLMAKGVRKIKSKLAGGIELFSISAITYIPGKRDISTLVSTRLVTHYGNIVAELPRTMLGYEFLKTLNKSTQDECDEEFYHMLVTTLRSLADLNIDPVVTEDWFRLRLLKLLGHQPNLNTNTAGEKLTAGEKYVFDFDTMTFAQSNSGHFDDRHIKLLRLLSNQLPEKLIVITGLNEIANDLKGFLKTLLNQSMQQ